MTLLRLAFVAVVAPLLVAGCAEFQTDEPPAAQEPAAPPEPVVAFVPDIDGRPIPIPKLRPEGLAPAPAISVSAARKTRGPLTDAEKKLLGTVVDSSREMPVVRLPAGLFKARERVERLAGLCWLDFELGAHQIFVNRIANTMTAVGRKSDLLSVAVTRVSATETDIALTGPALKDANLEKRLIDTTVTSLIGEEPHCPSRTANAIPRRR